MTASRFERMLAIPEEEYHQLRSLQQVKDPHQNQFQSLASEYQKQSFIPNISTRVQRQGETLGEMVRLKDELRQRLVESTPKPYQSRAQSLFRFIENKMNINEKGEVTDGEGRVIFGSNIGDLVQHAVRDRRRNIVPEGWSTFLNTLRDNNAPRMIMNYETLEELHGSTGKKPTLTPSTKISKAIKREIKDVNVVDSSSHAPSKRVKKQPSYLKSYVMGKGKAKSKYL